MKAHRAGLIFMITAAVLVVVYSGKVLLDVLYSKYDNIINPLANQYGVPVSWVKAVIGKESSFRENPPVRANDQSYGLMQITPKTAKLLGFEGSTQGLLDPATNIRLGIMLLAQLRGRYGSDFRAVYSAYNSGNGKNYLTNPDVAAHVEGAVAWLKQFQAA